MRLVKDEWSFELFELSLRLVFLLSNPSRGRMHFWSSRLAACNFSVGHRIALPFLWNLADAFLGWMSAALILLWCRNHKKLYKWMIKGCLLLPISLCLVFLGVHRKTETLTNQTRLVWSDHLYYIGHLNFSFQETEYFWFWFKNPRKSNQIAGIPHKKETLKHHHFFLASDCPPSLSSSLSLSRFQILSSSPSPHRLLSVGCPFISLALRISLSLWV